MDLSGNPNTSDHLRMMRQAKEIGVIVLVIIFYLVYRFTALNVVLDKAINPAVAGITLAYGKTSSFIYRVSGLDFGFVSSPPDSEFLFSVQLATYVNEHHAAPLLALASDRRLPIEKRERALRALLKFGSTSDWIQAFLNELPKGGLLGLYDEEAPLLDELFSRIRADGGVRQDLVRAYAEVVFGFMLQVPDAVVRRHAMKWVSDVLPEEAIFLIASRLEREEDPKVREAIENALLNLRAVSQPKAAAHAILPHYQKPRWPTLRVPLSAVLSRLGHDGAVEYLRYAIKSHNVKDDQENAYRIAMTATPYPASIPFQKQRSPELARLEKAREVFRRDAWERYQQNTREQRQRERELMLARATTKEETNARSAQDKQEEAPSETSSEDSQETAVSAMNARERAMASARKKRTVTDQEGPQQMARATTASEENESAGNRVPVVIDESEKESAAQKDKVAVDDQRLPVKKSEEVKKQSTQRVDATAEKYEKAPPKQFFPPSGSADPEEAAAYATAKEPGQDQYASLPAGTEMPEDYFPPSEEMAKPPKSLMNYVDVVFEVKDKKGAIVFESASTDKPTGVILTQGNKGKADLEVMIGEEKWYQVKTKQGNGWVKAASLSVFNLSPATAVPAEAAKTEPRSTKSLDAEREESTYFEASVPDAVLYAEPGERSKKIGTLTEEIAYLAVKSEKRDGDRWFLLQIRSGEQAWARGVDLQLADVQQPAQMKIPTQPMSLRNQKSAFMAEWIVAGVKGVGVYSRPSIAGKIIQQINPPTVFKVLELSAGGGKEWYRIQLTSKKDGWVQALDVNLTKPN